MFAVFRSNRITSIVKAWGGYSKKHISKWVNNEGENGRGLLLRHLNKPVARRVYQGWQNLLGRITWYNQMGNVCAGKE